MATLAPIALTPELSKALDNYAERLPALPKAAVVRNLLAERLSELGYDIKEVHPVRGGNRRKKED